MTFNDIIQAYVSGKTDLKPETAYIYKTQGRSAAMAFINSVAQKGFTSTLVPSLYAVVNDLDKQAATDATKVVGQATPVQTSTGFMPGDKQPEVKGDVNLPEVGGINTPWGKITWGVTNNKALITYLVIAALAVIAIIYITRNQN